MIPVPANTRVWLAGYAAVFGEVTSIGGYFDEVLARGAFTKTLQVADVLAYFDHDRGRILGRTVSGTLSAPAVHLPVQPLCGLDGG